MRLWVRVALVVALVSGTALLGLGVIAVEVAASTATAAALEAQERDAAALAATVGRWVDEQGDVLLGWTLAFPLAELNEARRVDLARAVLVGVPSTVVVVVVDADGQLVAEPAYFDARAASAAGRGTDWTPADPARAARLVDVLPVTEALARPSGVAVGEASPDHATVPFAVVASRDPELLVGAEVALAVTAELERHRADDRAVVLADAHGHGLFGADHRLVDLAAVRPLLGTTARFAYEARGESVRGAVAPVSGTDWSVLVLEPERVALEGARGIQRGLVPVVAGAVFLSVVLGLILARTITGPLGRLRDTVQLLAEGRYGVRADVGGPDEVGELARAFNDMSGKLAENQAEIERQRDAIQAFNRELQRKVDEATRELREAQERVVRSGQFAAVAQIGAGLAHELNNPLTAVLGLSQLLEQPGDSPGKRAVIADLREQAERCRRVVDAMVRLSADGAGEVPRGEASLAGLLADLDLAAGPAVRRRGVAWVCGAPPDARVGVDPAEGVRVLGTLVSALAAGLPSGASLAVDARVEPPWAEIRLAPDRPVGEGRDDWMASGLDVWLARRALDGLGAVLVEPTDRETAWSVRLPLRA